VLFFYFRFFQKMIELEVKKCNLLIFEFVKFKIKKNI